MKKYPRFGLRIVLFVVGDKRSIGEMLEARGVISHHIVGARYVPGLMTVTMLPLVERGNTAEL